jgi:hypothetical protein
LGAVAAVELGEHAGDVCLGGEAADDQTTGDVGIGEAGGEELEDLALPLRELGELSGSRSRVRPCDDLVDQAPGDRGRD